MFEVIMHYAKSDDFIVSICSMENWDKKKPI